MKTDSRNGVVFPSDLSFSFQAKDAGSSLESAVALEKQIPEAEESPLLGTPQPKRVRTEPQESDSSQPSEA